MHPDAEEALSDEEDCVGLEHFSQEPEAKFEVPVGLRPKPQTEDGASRGRKRQRGNGVES